MQIHLGCWHRHIPGFVHVDLCDMPHVDYKANIGDLSMFGDGSASLIYSSHSLEYFDRAQAKDVLSEWYRVLAPRGILRVAVPDFDALVKVYEVSDKLDTILGPLFGRMEIDTPQDYADPNVSWKVVKTILSYTDYVQQRVWQKTF